MTIDTYRSIDASGRRTRKSDFLDELDRLVPWEAWADAGYLGVESREGADAVEWHVAARQSQVTDETRAAAKGKRRAAVAPA